jgi:Tfp pilus assembly protein PilX
MKTRSHQSGSTLAMALITIAVLAFAAASVFYYITNRNQTSANAGSWQEALMVAESGTDMAMSALNASVKSPGTAWAAWTPSDATTFPKTYTGVLPAHTGEGNNKMYVSVKIDNTIKDGSGQVWYRIRSSGSTEIPGPKRVAYAPSQLSASGKKNHANFLRKVAYKNDATGGALHLPQTTRTVEMIAQPVSARVFSKALVVQKSIALAGSSSTDSFDSTDPTKSTNGQYDPSKRQNHGDVASNSSGNISDLGNNNVYGNASSNAGVLQNTQNVHGTVYNNYSTTIAPVAEPTFAYYTPGPSTISNLAAPLTLLAGTQAAPTNYKISTLDLSGTSKQLIFAPPVPGQESYVNVWVTGDITMGGSGFIQQMPGVHVTVYVNGNVNVTGSSFDNENGRAAYLTINGITPADGSTRTFTVTGNGTFIGVVNAPSYALTIWGSGDFMGALVMLSANLGGSAGYHYDESLGSVTSGNNPGYKMASWIEDIR